MAGFSMRNCPKCGNVFTFVKTPICPQCQEEEEQIFETVRRYLKDNPNKTLQEVSDETEVSVKKILKYIKEGRIDIGDSTITFPCENCGKEINRGKYCGECAKKLKNKFNSSFAKPMTAPPKRKSVMYTQQDK